MKLGKYDVAVIDHDLVHWCIYQLLSDRFKGFCMMTSGSANDKLICTSDKVGTLQDVCKHVAEELNLEYETVLANVKMQLGCD